MSSNNNKDLKTKNLPLDSLASTANAFAAAHGVQVEKQHANADGGGSYFECAPISLLPNAYPRACFEQAVTLAPSFNELVDRISRDADFLQQTLQGDVSEADPYTAKLLQLYQDIYCCGTNNANVHALSADRLGIHRSDYMLHQGQIKQVELNTIASSFAGLSTQVASLHSFLVQRFGNSIQDFLQQNKQVVLASTTNSAGISDDDKDNNKKEEEDGVPVNPALDRLPKAMHVAVERYKQRFCTSSSSAADKQQKQQQPVAVLFVVQEGESNTVDQRMLEFRLFREYQIPVVRRSLTQLHSQLHCNAATGALTVPLNDNANNSSSSSEEEEQQRIEIALVYYRAGYAPTDYPAGYDGVEWQARVQLERSRATKSPSLGYHLAGTKKVQQELARPGVLERFFPTASNDDVKTTAAAAAQVVEGMRRAFAGLYSLGQDATEQDLAAVQRVLKDGQEDKFVLKPQREGGGYNYYGDDLAAKLRDNVVQEQQDNNKNNNKKLILKKSLGEFILMERLFPPEQPAILLRSGRIEGVGDSISELGCFGTLVVAPDGEVVHNEYAGFLLRTKFSNVNEGGVASGFATLSSPYLC